MALSKKQMRSIGPILMAARAARKSGRKDSWNETLQELFLSSPSDEDLALLIAQEYRDAGDSEKAIDILQNYLQLGQVTPAILNMVAALAMTLGLYDTATKVLAQLTSIEPQKANHYVNLSECLRRQDQERDALVFMLQVLPNFPDSASVWNSFATLVEINAANKAFDDFALKAECARMVSIENSEDEFGPPVRDIILTAFRRAHKLDPNNLQVLNNLGSFLCHTPEALSFFKMATQLSPEDPQPFVGMAVELLGRGRLAEAWPHYEHRKTPGQGASKNFELDVPLPEWNGQLDRTKSLLVCGEQGLGDELFFFSVLKQLVPGMKKVYVACDPRLVSILERSFPTVTVAAYSDNVEFGRRKRKAPDIIRFIDEGKIDFQTLSGSVPQYIWPEPAALPNLKGGFVTACNDHLPEKLSPTDGKLRIGISWRSSNLSGGRASGYWGLERAMELAFYVDAEFVNLQYDASEEELAAFSRYANFRTTGSVNLRNDLEANLAIMDTCDLIIGPPIATQMLAFALGRPTWIVAMGPPWYSFGFPTGKPLPYAPHTHILKTANIGEDLWEQLVKDSAREIIAMSDKVAPSPDNRVQQQGLNSRLIAIFPAGKASHTEFLQHLRWKFQDTQDELIFLPKWQLQSKNNNKKTIWPDYPLEKRLHAKVLFGGGANLAAVKDIADRKPVSFAMFMRSPSSAISTQMDHHMVTIDADIEADTFISDNRHMISTGYRLLTDFADMAPEEAIRIFEPVHAEAIYEQLVEIFDMFDFVGFCEETYDADIKALVSWMGLGAININGLTLENPDCPLPYNTDTADALFAVDQRLFEYACEKRSRHEGPFFV